MNIILRLKFDTVVFQHAIWKKKKKKRKCCWAASYTVYKSRRTQERRKQMTAKIQLKTPFTLRLPSKQLWASSLKPNNLSATLVLFQ